MSRKITQVEHKDRITRVVDYIFKNIGQDVSMHTLARQAHYSPFHLQKLFKHTVGETPKQFSLQLQAETAFHLLIIHPRKPIQDIAVEAGFSSPAVFSRAMKNYFGHSPEQLRNLSHRRQMKILHSSQPSTDAASVLDEDITSSPFRIEPTGIDVVREKAITGIYCLAPFDNYEAIRSAFQTLDSFAGTCGVSPINAPLYGILTPHQRNTYRAFLPLEPGVHNSPGFPICEIKGGTFARFTVKGDIRQANKAAHYFYRRWLPASGYKIGGIAGVETFSENPADTPYCSLQRQIHIPIEPDR